MDVRRTISTSNNWLDLKAKIDASPNTKEKGDIFELLTKLYLQIEPRFVTKIETVWLYSEVPTNLLKKLNLPSRDMGIDLLAETHLREYWAIQCKYKADETKSLTWREISTFQSLAFSKAKGISFGLIATTVDRSASIFKDQKEDVKLLAGEVWRDLDQAFFVKARKILDRKTARPTPFKPRKHQRRAVRNAKKHFINEKATRGKMIMPCGTGKSLTAYWIAKQLEAKTILIAVPSLSLINQTLKAWLREVVANKQTVDWIAVCSDKTAGEVDSAISTQDLGIPTNTDPEMIARWLRKRSIGLKVVFTTYQSGKVIAEASRSAKRVFDLGIMDEAHKTVGDRDKTFAHLLSDDNIKIRKRVFMTATERRYAGNRDEIISMDNPEVYGDTFELLTFKEALEQDPPILSDYKILTMLIHKEDVAKYIQERAIVKPDRGKWDDGVQAEMLAGVVALNQAMEKYPIKHAVSFHTSIAKAQAFRGNQQTYTEAVQKNTDKVETFFVSGKTPTSIRSRIIKEFASSDKALISNARCLTEGVDIPKIDGVLFADPKRSTIDIVQAVGRALRTAKDKEYGYIIVPVLIEDETDFENSGAFQTIITVLRALASNDERIVEYFREKSSTGSNRGIIEHIGSDQLLERVNLEEFIDSIELHVWNKLAKLSWRPFKEARDFIRSLKIGNQIQWKEYVKDNLPGKPKRPSDIPSNPNRVYKIEGWKGYGDWLGTGRIANQGREYLSYAEAKIIVHRLGLDSQSKWQLYCRGRVPNLPPKPSSIPSDPRKAYQYKGWLDIYDWLGHTRLVPEDGEYLPYKDAANWANTLGLSGQSSWLAYLRGEYPDLPEKPFLVPASPNGVYRGKGWTSWGDWLGTGNIAAWKHQYKSFKEARTFIRSLNLRNQKEWKLYTQGKLKGIAPKPKDIPSNPNSVYKNKDWISLGDWLGNQTVATLDRKYYSYEKAKSFVRSLGLKSQAEWRNYTKGLFPDIRSLPPEIPKAPHAVYGKQGKWENWGRWLGTDRVNKKDREYLTYDDAKIWVHKLKLESFNDWLEYRRGKYPEKPRLPKSIPGGPSTVYKESGWKGWGDWVGTGRVADIYVIFRSFSEARDFVRKLGLKSVNQWRLYAKGELNGYGKKPSDIPAGPSKTYKNKGWISWPDFLGYEPKRKKK